VITPRRTRLVRVPDLHAFQRAIAWSSCPPDVGAARSCAVLVSTASAGSELLHTLENLVLLEPAARGSHAVAWPDVLTRAEWYERLHHAKVDARRMLSPIEREVLLGRAARQAIAAGVAPPFRVRPALVAEMLVFLDTMLRLGRTVDAFERLFVTELEAQAPTDRGAERLLRQTRFLVATYREYRTLVRKGDGVDEHLLRDELLASDAPSAYARVVVTAGDRSCGPHGLWPVDFDLLARLPNLREIDVVATEGVLASGFHERLQAALPGFDEVEFGHPAALAGRVPRLVVPAGEQQPFFVSRDREEEIGAVTRWVKRRAAQVSLDRVAVVCRRPLPYVYLAQSQFGAAGVPFQAFDELPLAAEPFAAALDLVFRSVESGLVPKALLAVLRSPHFSCGDADAHSSASLVALEQALRDKHGVGSVDELERAASEWDSPAASPLERRARSAARALVALARELEPLRHRMNASVQCAFVLAFLERHAPAHGGGGLLAVRTARARQAIGGALAQLASAHVRHDDPPADFTEFVARIRRWMEGQTFAPRSGAAGLHLVDADAARYGDFDEAYLVGLIEREWPDTSGRSIFYPLSLLTNLGWPSERARLAAARAEFNDLVRLAASRVSLFTFSLEDDALVEPSPFLDDLAGSGLSILTEDAPAGVRVLPDEALALEPFRPDVLRAEARDWAMLRSERTPPRDAAFHGVVGQVRLGAAAVRRLETFLDCPFKYFAESVLGLKDESDEEPGGGARAEGQFLHELLAAFYEEWQQAGGREITPANLDAARAMFKEVADRRIADLPPAATALWRARILGCAARTGIAEVVLRAEASTAEPVVGRLLEYRFDGPCEIRSGGDARELQLRGVADRIDLLGDGRFRLIDYKLGKAPDVRRAIQLPIYAVQAAQQLPAEEGRARHPSDVAYLAFGESDPYVRLASRPAGLAQAIADGQARLLEAAGRIEQGLFPPRPAELSLCGYCAYARVCRKDYADGQ
jgi:RecB family exonuclease